MAMTGLKDDSEKAIFDFAEIYIETLKDEKEQLEPLEQYIHEVKMRLYSDPKSFQQNFLDGYRILMNELKKH